MYWFKDACADTPHRIVGWYTVGTQPTPLDLAIHTQLLVYNESPIFLQLHPTGNSSSSSAANAGSNLPLDLYESIVDIVNGKSETRFVRIAGEDGGYRVETGEAERIAVESASRTAVASASGNKAGQESSESACRCIVDVALPDADPL